MALSLGIVGLPNVGKSTLFRALTKKEVDIANYPFCTIDPNVGVVEVPDERLEKLAHFSSSAKTIPAVCEFVDIAGLVKGAHQGEGLGNAFLGHIKEVNAILHLVRVFESPDITHVSGSIDPSGDIATINYELVMSDLENVERAKERVEREAKSGDKDAKIRLVALNKLQEGLRSGKLAREVLKDPKEQESVRELNLLTSKPTIFVVNVDDKTFTNKNQVLFSHVPEFNNERVVVVCATFEDELNSLSPSEREEFTSNDRGVAALIRASYELLGLITFFTTGEKETRGWTVRSGAKAPEAAGVIHTDFEKYFIRADVIFWEKLLEAGSWANARAKGLLRTEGREYLINDGDVIEVKHGA